MGRLEVVFKVGVAYPVMGFPDSPEPIQVTFPETGNTVQIELPDVSRTIDQHSPGVFADFTVRVKREADEQTGRDTTYTNCSELKIAQDAARAFWMLFESFREYAFRNGRENGSSTVAGYPVAPSDEIQNNPLVRTASYEWWFNGEKLNHCPLSGIPAIEINGNCWSQARKRLASGTRVEPYISVALDAAYFSRGDPLRAIIMSCAAWETAMRSYLSNVASQFDPSFQKESERGDLGRLYSLVKKARDASLFEPHEPGLKAEMRRQRKLVTDQLPKWRSNLLHHGELPPGETAIDAVLAVLNAIDWLFS